MKTRYLSEDKPYLSLIPPFQYDPDFCKKTVFEMLVERIGNNPDKIAMNFYGTKIKTSSFLEKIDKTAKAYVAMGIKPNDNISFFGLNTPELVESLYAISKIGAVSEWFNPNAMTPELLRNHINKNNVKALFIIDIMFPIVKEAIKSTNIKFVVVNSLMDSLPFGKKTAYYAKNNTLELLRKIGLGKITAFDRYCKSEKSYAKTSYYKDRLKDTRFISWNDFICKAQSSIEIEPNHDYEKMSMVIHTGGTTGPIKRIAMNDYAMNSAPYQISLMPNSFKAGDSLLQITPPMVAWSLESIHAAMFFNMTLNMIASYDRNEFAKIILKTKSNHYFTVPSFVKRIKEDPIMRNKDLSFIKTIFHGGEGIDIEDDKQIDDVLESGASPTKSALGYGQNEEFAGFFVNLHIPGTQKIYGTCGVPLAGNDYLIYDLENKCELPYGKDEKGNNRIGALLVSGPSTMIGYIGDDAHLNDKTILNIGGKKYIDTGDLAYADENGRMFYYTREQRIIRTQQGKIFVNVIENLLAQIEEIQECCVVKMPDAENVATASCHIVLKEPYRNTAVYPEHELIQKIISEIESKTKEMYTYYVPSSYRFRSNLLPLTAFGKVAYKVLEDENTKEYGACGSKIEKIKFVCN